MGRRAMRRKLTLPGPKLEVARCLLCLSIAVIGQSCCNRPDVRPRQESVTNIASTAQLEASIGKVVQLDGILYQTRGGTFVGCHEDINAYLEPPPDLSKLKIGSKVSVVGTLTSHVLPPYDPNMAIPIARPTNAQATTEYILNNYKITVVTNAP